LLEVFRGGMGQRSIEPFIHLYGIYLNKSICVFILTAISVVLSQENM